uniref:Uncharacterized protein n=1 Tax=Anguilla anguilla TaxID=7936 RepID=A0A0E9W4D1_ANGAN
MVLQNLCQRSRTPLLSIASSDCCIRIGMFS